MAKCETHEVLNILSKYTCEKCKYDNIYFNDDEWHILLDYIN